jgi:hypothetical protein
MEKKLPKIFANKITKKMNNNKTIYTSEIKKEELKESSEQLKKDTLVEKHQEKTSKTINQKINEIFKKKEYIYKIPVKIKIKGKEINTKIIGKNNTSIITLNNEQIKINEIEEIKIDKKNE